MQFLTSHSSNEVSRGILSSCRTSSQAQKELHHMTGSSMSRLNAALPTLEKAAFNAAPQLAKSYHRSSSSNLGPWTSSSGPRDIIPRTLLSQCYATETSQQHSTSFLTIPTPSTSAHHDPRPFKPPSLSLIRSNLPPTKAPPSIPKLYRGTVTRVGTMTSTVQIAYNAQRFDSRLKRTQLTVMISAHEPTGYLRAGDVVEFARFSPATMADRYECGQLNRRGSGVRYEVHRVVTPFGQGVQERKEVPREGEVGDRFGAVEFERRRKELGRPWNKNREMRVRILEEMCEAVGMDVEAMSKGLGAASKEDGAFGPSFGDMEQRLAENEAPTLKETVLEEVSDSQRDIAAQLQKLRVDPSSARSQGI